ncbi:zinc finger CW-type PWWP domain protein 1 isoform X6 [Notamacropus eugenii]|uniref:zinc finger CW-type PWWP domain protein 1 isoform X6 n=1 Tax=Notamacropus eugenii TaxID=9315 RepID=UPI003B67558E
MMTTLKSKEGGKESKKAFIPPGQKVYTSIPCSLDAPDNEDTQGIGPTGVNANQGQSKDKMQKKRKEKDTRKSSESDEGKGPVAPKPSKGQDAKGDERKTKKEKMPSLTNEQFEEIVQCVLKKSLQECLDMTCETSCVQRIEYSSGAKEKSTATTDVNRKLLGIPYSPAVPDSKEDGIIPGIQSPKSDPLPSEKKQNKLSLSKKRKQASQCITWVQCSFPNCEKWRRLHRDIDPSVLPDDWSCSENTDVQFNHCDIPEEAWSESENDVIYAAYIPGSIIWAKQHGYPWWPGMIESDPDLEQYFLFGSPQEPLPSKYHVTFFGDVVSRAWIPSNMLKSFQDLSLAEIEPKKIKNKDYSQKLMAALAMAREAQQINIQDRVSLFGFHIRYKADAEKSSSSEEEEDFQEAGKPQKAKSSKSCISKERDKEPCSTNYNPIHTSKKKLRLEGLKKKFTAPQRKTTVTKLPERGGDKAPQNQFPATQSPGKKSDPQGSVSKNPLLENKASSDLNIEQLVEEVREGFNQKEEAPTEEEDELSLVLSEE